MHAGPADGISMWWMKAPEMEQQFGKPHFLTIRIPQTMGRGFESLQARQDFSSKCRGLTALQNCEVTAKIPERSKGVAGR